jgi:phytanoyl-CoA hydroxylase
MLCDQLSRTITGVAREHLAGVRPSLDFWRIFQASQRGVSVFWDMSRESPASLPAEEWERFAMRIGHGLHEADPVFAGACLQGVVGEALADAVGGDPRVVQSAVIYKQPHCDSVQFGFHQDSAYITSEPDTLMLAFVALDAMNTENGCLEVIPGSHKRELLVRLRVGEMGFVPDDGRDPPPVDGAGAVSLVIDRGSLVVARGRLLHGSKPNRSNGPRRALIVHAMDVAASRLWEGSWVQPPDDGFAPIRGSSST